ncbi:hypothetical protein PspLS_11376, partial [Pyricularia sp. CBS 133598]
CVLNPQDCQQTANKSAVTQDRRTGQQKGRSGERFMALAPPPEGLDLTETRVPDIIGASVTTWSLAAGAVGLRIFAKRLRGSGFWWDDYLACVAFVLAGINVWVLIGYMTPRGTGKHIWAGPPDAAKAWAIGILIAEIVYMLTTCFVKYSTLCFYWRLFNTGKRNRIPIWILFGLITIWGIATFFTSIFQCVPTQSWWQRFDPVVPMSPSEYTCNVNTTKFFIANCVPTIVTDVIVIILPIPYIWSLQMRVEQKVAVLGIFLLGISVTIASIIRFSYVLNLDLQSPDVTWNIIPAFYWTIVETNIAIICCCLPTLKPILNLVMDGWFVTCFSSQKTTDASGGDNNAENFETIGGTTWGPAARKNQAGQNDLELLSGPVNYVDANKLPTTVRAGESEQPFTRLHDDDGRSPNGEPSPNELASPANLGVASITHEVAAQGRVGPGRDT